MNTLEIMGLVFLMLCGALHTTASSTVLKIHLTVAQNGGGNFKTINEAIDASPNRSLGRFNIKIKKGNYTEIVVVPSSKTNITLIGDGIDQTIISGNKNAKQGITTYNTATLSVKGWEFVARDLTIENTAGPEKAQAVALLSEVESAFYRCKITGYQDTLYSFSENQFFRDCSIYGTVDFIFGDASAIFQNCDIYARLPPRKLNTITIVSQGRTNPRTKTGIVIHNCRITAAEDLRRSDYSAQIKSYLGRPWKNYSRTIVMQSFIDNIIQPRGWLEWTGNKTDLSTIYYAEYQNRGPGASTRGRVQWSSFHRINIKQASLFTVRNFISGESWLPSLGIPFFKDLL